MQSAEEDTGPAGQRVLFRVSIVFVLVVPVCVSLYASNSVGAWIALLAGSFTALMSKFDALAEFSLGPLKARMREAADEATATVAQLRELAASLSQGFLTDLIASSFMGGITLAKRLEMHGDLISKLKTLGVSDQRLQEIQTDWTKGIDVIYHRAIRDEMLAPLSNEDRKRYNDLHHQIEELADFATWNVPSPDVYKAFARTHNLLTSTVESWIEDFQHFRQTGEIRRRSEFVTR